MSNPVITWEVGLSNGTIMKVLAHNAYVNKKLLRFCMERGSSLGAFNEVVCEFKEWVYYKRLEA